MKILYSYFLIFLLIHHTSTTAQSFAWAEEFEGEYSEVTAMTVDNSGNMYAAINYSGEIDFNPNAGEYTLFGVEERTTTIQKLDADRELIWTATFEAIEGDDIIGNNLIINTIKTDASGSVYLTGSYTGSIDFDPGEETFIEDAVGYQDQIFVLKLAANSDFLWVKTFGATCHDMGQDLTIDQAGNVCVIGSFCQTVDFNPGEMVYELEAQGLSYQPDIFILKLNENGDFMWANSIASEGEDQAFAITSNSTNDYYIGGYYSMSADFDGSAAEFIVPAVGEEDAFLLKLNEAGDFVWVKTIAGADHAQITAIELDLDENLYCAGDFTGNDIDFAMGDTPFEMSSEGLADIFVLKLTNTDEFEWAKQLGGEGNDQQATLALSTSNSLYITGAYTADIDVNPGEMDYFLSHDDTEMDDRTDFFLTTLSDEGDFIQAIAFTGNNDDNCVDVSAGSDESIYLSGNIQSDLGVDINPTGDDFLVTGLLYNPAAFVLKLNDDFLSVENSETNLNFTVYPNPTVSDFSILFEQQKNQVEVAVLDITGQLIMRNNYQSIQQLNLTLNAVPQGVYLLKVVADKEEKVIKLVKH